MWYVRVMPVEQLLMYLPLACLLACAAGTDLRSRRIPNWLTLTMAVTGVAQSLTPLAVVTPGQSLVGLLVGLVLPLAIYAVGGLGAGDVKLLAGVGAWVGAWPLVMIVAAAAVIGLVIVLAQCAYHGRLVALFQNAWALVMSVLLIRRLGVAHVIETGQSRRTLDRQLPYAVPVLLGTAAVLAFSVARGAGGMP